MNNNKFLSEVASKDFIPETKQTNKYYCQIMAINKMKQVDGMSLIRGSLMYHKYMDSNENEISTSNDKHTHGLTDYDHVKSIVIATDNDLQCMGGGSQVGISLSQQRTDMIRESESSDDETDYDLNVSSTSTSLKDTNAYNRLYLLFCEVVGSIKNETDMKEAMNIFERLEFSLKAKGHKKRKINSTDTTFLGEINGHRCVEKRHKTWNEK